MRALTLDRTDVPLNENLDYYETRRALADPDTPVDCWGQATDTRDLNELMDQVRPLVTRHGVSAIIEPYAGLGSGALTARHLGLDYFGWEVHKKRALIALAKGFARATDVSPGLAHHDDLIAVGSSRRRHTLENAVLLIIHLLAERFGSTELAVEKMCAELNGLPPPGAGGLVNCRFQGQSVVGCSSPVLFHICPPFPRGANASPSEARPPTSMEFLKLIDDLSLWLLREVGNEDVVLAEYFNHTAALDVGIIMAEALLCVCDHATIVVTSRSLPTQPCGFSGFVLARRGAPIEPPKEWLQ
ncbi:MAG TPA: hypothetical protein VGP18_07715 [Solirubrobacteraceae bacterium]|jgi:hypothetical protein|nr:hypothetical protein [Solirubrobacteraceae bacterium]